MSLSKSRWLLKIIDRPCVTIFFLPNFPVSLCRFGSCLSAGVTGHQSNDLCDTIKSVIKENYYSFWTNIDYLELLLQAAAFLSLGLCNCSVLVQQAYKRWTCTAATSVCVLISPRWFSMEGQSPSCTVLHLCLYSSPPHETMKALRQICFHSLRITDSQLCFARARTRTYACVTEQTRLCMDTQVFVYPCAERVRDVYVTRPPCESLALVSRL